MSNEQEASFIVLGSSMSSADRNFPNFEEFERLESFNPAHANSEISNISHSSANKANPFQSVDGGTATNDLSVSKAETAEIHSPHMMVSLTNDQYITRMQKLEAENEVLRQSVCNAEVKTNHIAVLNMELDSMKRQTESNDNATILELKKALSEKKSILKNQVQIIERLEQKNRMLVKSSGFDSMLQVSQQDHDRQIDILKQKLSKAERKNSQLQDKLTENQANHVKEIQMKNLEVNKLMEQVNMLQDQSDTREVASKIHSKAETFSLDPNHFILQCPLCEKRHKDLIVLQIHVEKCVLAFK